MLGLRGGRGASPVSSGTGKLCMSMKALEQMMWETQETDRYMSAETRLFLPLLHHQYRTQWIRSNKLHKFKCRLSVMWLRYPHKRGRTLRRTGTSVRSPSGCCDIEIPIFVSPPAVRQLSFQPRHVKRYILGHRDPASVIVPAAIA